MRQTVWENSHVTAVTYVCASLFRLNWFYALLTYRTVYIIRSYSKLSQHIVDRFL